MSEKVLSRRNRWIIGGAAGLLVVGGSAAIATAAFADEGDDVNDDGTAQTVDDDDDATPTAEPKISLTDAITTAGDEVGKGVFTSIELEGDNDKPLWQVDLVTSDGTEHEVTVDATNGDVTNHDKETEDDTGDWDEAKAADDKAKTTAEDAAAAALDKVGKGIVTSVELDDESGNPQWDVDVTTDDGKQQEVTVDAVAGKVTATNDDDDDDDSDDDSDNDEHDD